MPAKRYGPKYAVLAYECARDKKGTNKTCEELGISRQCFGNWMRTKKTFKFAVERGRDYAENNLGKNKRNLTDFIYDRLPRDLQKVWDGIHEREKSGSNGRRTAREVERMSTRERQSIFVHALCNTGFNASEASRVTMIPVDTFRQWRKRDKKFALLMKSVEEAQKDFIEGAFMELVGRKDVNAVLFGLRTKLRDRGYDPKVVIQHQVSGTVEHEHKHTITLDMIINRLPREAKALVLTTVRQLKKEKEEAKELPEHVEDAEYEEVS